MIPPGARNRVKVERSKLGTWLFYPNGSVVFSTALRGLLSHEAWSILADDHAEILRLDFTLPRSFCTPAKLRRLRMVKGCRLEYWWGTVVFGARSVPHNIAIEFSKGVLRLIREGGPRLFKKAIRNRIALFWAYFQEIYARGLIEI